MFYRGIKRFIDILLSVMGILVCLPIFFAIIIAIHVDSKGPAIFRQKRVGRARKTFYIYKFRTMSQNAPCDCPAWALQNASQYITRVGRFLRKTSLDELPQLFNILKGDMSIVGPRPVVEQELVLLNEREHNGAGTVRPGLTGLAQVSGRDMLDLHKKAQLDGDYVKRMSFGLDLKILWKTVGYVLQRRDIAEGVEGHAVQAAAQRSVSK
jgi:O-antigen biosynthesis protein WbqP